MLIWAGDADWICNWVGNEAVVEQVSFNSQGEFRGKTLEPYTVNGVQKGTFKTAENFSFLRIFEAGHEVPYYRMSSFIVWEYLLGTNVYTEPEASLQVFSQTMKKKPIFST